MKTFPTFYKTIYNGNEHKVYFNTDLKKHFIEITGEIIFVSQEKLF